MGALERIGDVNNEVEAMTLEARLTERGIPHSIRSYADSAYDGLFQVSMGWGCVEASSEHAAEIRNILKEIREPSTDTELSQEPSEEATWQRPNARLWVLVSLLLLAMIVAYYVLNGFPYWGGL